LAPNPGRRGWLNKNAPAEWRQAGEPAPELAEKPAPRGALTQGAARYLAQELKDGKPLDPVARFHLGNGARVERLNWAADPSAKGFKQSYGLMVNYLYDPKKLDKNRAALAQSKIPVAPAIKDLLP
ncbi:MAG: malonyl-CoA decarboxylase family protein, partial [Hydrogenophaga sp.]|uniref:malonyl-CoA decarboxylase domain-containing protein n=1 Tax=Hydrogenophaga sp. TaxID=1904254 RepID=UPI0025B8529F